MAMKSKLKIPLLLTFLGLASCGQAAVSDAAALPFLGSHSLHELYLQVSTLQASAKIDNASYLQRLSAMRGTRLFRLGTRPSLRCWCRVRWYRN